MLVNKSKELFDTSVLQILRRFLSKKFRSNLKITSECLAKIITTTTIRIQLEVAADFGSLFFFFYFITFQRLPSNFCLRVIVCLDQNLHFHLQKPAWL